ncbi:hypothetical protein BWQ96_08910 [Gracilariopsis chorda]|uniref:Protein phosphatase inhibitor 2 n=1 Tax=Gracilariopsis chorda TaxID=448386 RepID=A0A2V3IH78_9FLOR|nr:hypothetical protein BWQ96_08910 [Gracilariopsis chorda]|eukprot:PXF41412.1 hypothetical protein BWQ96_08910 [Gracilariopsis chorda]
MSQPNCKASDRPDPDPDPRARRPSEPAMSEPDANASPPSVSEAPKKKSRLHWDEQNLISNALEMERSGPRMKIDEPKTPFVGSETGSSTSGSVLQSPPESPSFIPGERLVGFQSLENSMPKNAPATSSDGASSAGSTGRSVHIRDTTTFSGGSSPRSREEFEARRKAHYRNEARVSLALWSGKVLEDSDDDKDDGSEDGRDPVGNGPDSDQLPNGRNNPGPNGERRPAGEEASTLNTSSSDTNGHIHPSDTTVEQKRA